MRSLAAALVSATLIAGPVGIVVALFSQLSLVSLGVYGYVLFLGVPMASGFLATLLDSRWSERTPSVWRMLGVTSETAVFAACTFLVFGFDGLVCVALMIPVALPACWIGGALALVGLERMPSIGGARASVLVLAPLTVAAILEPIALSDPALRRVVTRVEIEADASAVWEAVVAFPPIEDEPGFPFNVGIAYPVAATIEGRGVGAVRRCTFSTGSFVEPVTVWEPGRLLEFDVSSNPASLEELSFRELRELPHLSGVFEAERGRFFIEPREGGGVTLEGTTWYQQRLWPQLYWNRVADWMIGRIHRRVLEHISRSAKT